MSGFALGAVATKFCAKFVKAFVTAFFVLKSESETGVVVSVTVVGTPKSFVDEVPKLGISADEDAISVGVAIVPVSVDNFKDDENNFGRPSELDVISGVFSSNVEAVSDELFAVVVGDRVKSFDDEIVFVIFELSWKDSVAVVNLSVME